MIENRQHSGGEPAERRYYLASLTRPAVPSKDDVEQGDLHVRFDARSVEFRGRPVALTPRSYDVLVHLFENRNRVVSKKELLERFWPEHASEHALRQEVFALRNALRRSQAGSCVATVSRLGYRFDSHAGRTGGVVGYGVLPVSDRSKATRLALAGAAYLAARGDTSSFTRALDCYESVVTASPNCREALAGCARCLVVLAFRSALPAGRALRRTMRHLNVLFIQDPAREGPLYGALLAGVLRYDTHFATQALTELKARYPDDARMPHALALCHFRMGNLVEAIREQTDAIDLQPGSSELHGDLSTFQAFTGDYRSAREQLAALHDLDDGNAHLNERVATVLALQGNYDGAINLLGALQGRTPSQIVTLSIALARSGRQDAAYARIADLRTERDERFVSGYHLARFYAAIGDARTSAFFLRDAIEEPIMACLSLDPWFAGIRDGDAFHALLCEVARHSSHDPSTSEAQRRNEGRS